MFESGLGPESMFFKPQTGAEFEIWAVSRALFPISITNQHSFTQWDYHEPNIPWAECDGDIFYMQHDMGAGYCVSNKGYNGCGYAHCVGTITCHGC